eukprot:TRINITY_DN3256_c0_g1_i1.p1 TRINITY_DN3256_c0_g1~~TRINITY_DN3256_c0_g1_i1.p1  ORF type:complete len:306 (-),score=60.38 TRINITY_DN3256_c0_g1_i1:32-898(-)
MLQREPLSQRGPLPPFLRRRRLQRLSAAATLLASAAALALWGRSPLLLFLAAPASQAGCSSEQQHPGQQLTPAEVREEDILGGRRSALLSAGVALSVSSLAGSPLAAEALFGFFEGPKLVPYTVPGVFNISMPPEFVLSKEAPGLLGWRGNRIQVNEVMVAEAKAIRSNNLAEAVGPNVTVVGERLAAARPAVQPDSTIASALLNAREVPGQDVYIFEFESDYIHELQLFSVVKAQGKNYLCSVGLRTPALTWEDRKEIFPQILETFKPLEPQPARPAVQAATGTVNP